MRDGFKKPHETSPEEHGRGKHEPKRGSAGDVWDGGGFPEGTHGRGPMPYHKGHSAKPNGHPLEHHTGSSGRGADGIFGKGDGFKTRAKDVQHPASHAEFEALGADGD